MTKLILDIAYETKHLPQEESNISMTSRLIQHAVNAHYKDGLKGQMLRTYGRIQKKIDDAVEQKVGSIEIEESEKDMIKKALDETSFPAALAGLVMTLQDAVFSE